MKKENRFTDDQIQSMIEIGYGSRSIRKLRVSPKRIARIERGEEGKPDINGYENSITEEFENIAITNFPIITYIEDDSDYSDDSESSYSE